MARVQLSIDTQQLAQLLRQGDLHLSQLAPLDPQSKAALWQLCLNSCGTSPACPGDHHEHP